jgi:hypothetical protein
LCEAVELRERSHQVLPGRIPIRRYSGETGVNDRWRTSDQKLRWCAAALGIMEHQFRRVKGCPYLPLLQQALASKMKLARDAAA